MPTRDTVTLVMGAIVLSLMMNTHIRAHETENWVSEQRRYDREFTDIQGHFYRETA